MVKILAASDIHGSYDVVKRLADKAEKYNVDIILLAGDLHGPVEGSGEILNPFLEKNKKVFFIPGNWDSTAENERLKKKANSLHNQYVTYDGVNILGFGTIDMKMEHTKKDFEDMKKLFERTNSEKKVFVTHLHVAGTKAEFSGVKGDTMLRKAIDTWKPSIVLSGHIHESEGIEDKINDTIIFQIGRNGKIFEI